MLTSLLVWEYRTVHQQRIWSIFGDEALWLAVKMAIGGCHPIIAPHRGSIAVCIGHLARSSLRCCSAFEPFRAIPKKKMLENSVQVNVSLVIP